MTSALSRTMGLPAQLEPWGVEYGEYDCDRNTLRSRLVLEITLGQGRVFPNDFHIIYSVLMIKSTYIIPISYIKVFSDR